MPAPFASWAVPALLASMMAAAVKLPAAHGRTLTQAALVAPSKLAQVESWTWHITAQVAAPDCFERPVLLVNGELSPKIEVMQGNILEITVINALPEDWPAVSEGISMHWHGFRMRGSFWYDGTAYVSQCPILRGHNMTYRFPVDEPPGTYMWHSHSGAGEADGLSGQLIVHPRPGLESRHLVDGEHSLHLSDWYHTLASASAMQHNRPFDSGKVTNTSGSWLWVGNPQSILLNGNGFYQDCAIGSISSSTPVTCNVTDFWVPPSRSAINPFASSVNPGCAHANFTVEEGKTYLFRISNAASLTYLTVCFGGHNVTVVAADARPVEPFSAECVDVNAGQRLDVLLTADQPPGAYWVAAHVQYRPGSPSGYGVLRYSGTNDSTLPEGPLPQPGSVQPWTMEQLNQIVMDQEFLELDSDVNGTYQEMVKQVPQQPTLRLLLNITQPLLEQTGQLRWALNNVANMNNPPCSPLAELIHSDPGWLAQHTVLPEVYNAQQFQTSNLGVQEGAGTDASVYQGPNLGPAPVKPTAGLHLVPLEMGAVVEVVVQNMNANANNGDYRPGVGANRTAQEEHPFHLHGQHFWLVGQGLGNFTNSTELNLENPPLRDTATVPKSGYIVVRFLADNPGIWMWHCHLLWHRLMGQGLTFVTAVDQLPPPPAGLPACPSSCTYNAAPFNTTYVQEKYGASGFQIPTGR